MQMANTHEMSASFAIRETQIRARDEMSLHAHEAIVRESQQLLGARGETRTHTMLRKQSARAPLESSLAILTDVKTVTAVTQQCYF